MLFSRAVVENPVVHAQLPLVEGGVVFEVAEGYPDDVVVGGLVFVVGSCDRPPVKELCRAAWSVVFCDEAASPVATATGPVWQGLPQTPQVAEHVALGVCVQLAQKPTEVWSDCDNVVKTGMWETLAPQHRATAKRTYEGVVRHQACVASRRLISSLQWVASHQTLDTEDPHEKRNRDGNDQADRACKERAKGIQFAARTQ